MTSTNGDGTVRKAAERRRRPYVCQRCGDTLAAVGSHDIGVRIFKCRMCGTMDRRLPSDRRVAVDPLEREVGRWTGWLAPALIAGGLVLAVLVAAVFLLLGL